jgi:hypothetical protein
LSDYSGGVVLGWLGLYALWLGWRSTSLAGAWRNAIAYAVGAALPVLLLLFYQYRAFGSPWYPGQHYMPAVQWIDVGYQGVGWPEWKLFTMLLFDTRFGLFIASPWLVLSVVGLWQAVRGGTWLPAAEAWFLAVFTLLFLVFFSMVQYTQLQWVTGIRYIVPVLPAMFLLAFVSLITLPPVLRYSIVVLAFAESWALSMVRGIEIADSITRALLQGFQLPWINVLSKMAPQYLPYLAQGASPLPLFLLCAAIVYVIWRFPQPETL